MRAENKHDEKGKERSFLLAYFSMLEPFHFDLNVTREDKRGLLFLSNGRYEKKSKMRIAKLKRG
jgi:hypothetical protein